MPDDLPPTHHQVVAVSIKLRPQDFDIGDAALPKRAEGFAHEYMLHDPLA